MNLKEVCKRIGCDRRPTMALEDSCRQACDFIEIQMK